MNSTSQKIKLIVFFIPLVTFYCYALDLYVPLIPTIQEAFAVDPRRMQLTNSLFMLTIAGGQLFFGPLSDKLGRLPIVMTSLLIFISGTTLASLTESFDWFLTARIAQALGACGCYLSCFASIRDLYSDNNEATSMFGFLNVATSTSAIIAPSIGSFLGETFGWRSIFYGLTASATLNLMLCYWVYPQTKSSNHSSDTGFRQTFIHYWQIFCHPNYQLFTLPAAIGIASFFSIYSISPYFYMEHLMLSKQAYSLCYGSLGLAFFIGSSLCALSVEKLGIQRCLQLGLAIHSLACLVFCIEAMLYNQSLIIIQSAAILYIFGASFMVSSGIGGTMAPFQAIAGTAFALISAYKFTACFLIAEWVVHFYDQSLISLGLSFLCLNGFALGLLYRFKHTLIHTDANKESVHVQIYQKQEAINDQIL